MCLVKACLGRSLFCFTPRVCSYPAVVLRVEHGCRACVSSGHLPRKRVPSVWTLRPASTHAVSRGARCRQHLSRLLPPSLLRAALSPGQGSLRSLRLREESKLDSFWDSAFVCYPVEAFINIFIWSFNGRVLYGVWMGCGRATKLFDTLGPELI